MQIINFAQGHGIIYYEVMMANGKNYVVQYLAFLMCSGNIHILRYEYDFVSNNNRARIIRKWEAKK